MYVIFIMNVYLVSLNVVFKVTTKLLGNKCVSGSGKMHGAAF